MPGLDVGLLDRLHVAHKNNVENFHKSLTTVERSSEWHL